MLVRDMHLTGRPWLTDYLWRWGLIAACFLICMVGFRMVGVTIVWKAFGLTIRFVTLLLLFAGIYAMIGAWLPRLAWPAAIAADLLLSIVQVVAALATLVPLTYLAAMSGAPLLDAELARLDQQWFGFEWYTAAQWVADRPVLDMALRLTYYSTLPQAVTVLLIGSITRPNDRNGEIIWPFCIAILLTAAVFVFTPALGHAGHIGMEHIERLVMIRAGKWTEFDYGQIVGIINFPSFHTTLAILFIYAIRRHRWALAVSVPLNLLMIAATPSVGGHYLMDLPPGAAMAR
jgi:hypothetical protein